MKLQLNTEFCDKMYQAKQDAPSISTLIAKQTDSDDRSQHRICIDDQPVSKIVLKVPHHVTLHGRHEHYILKFHLLTQGTAQVDIHCGKQQSIILSNDQSVYCAEVKPTSKTIDVHTFSDQPVSISIEAFKCSEM